MNVLCWSVTFTVLSRWIQTPDSKWMSSLTLPLPPELIFPLVLWETAVKAAERANTWLLFLRTSKHAHRRAAKRVCAQTRLRRWRALLSLTPTGPLPENFITLSIPLPRLLCGLFTSLVRAFVSACVLSQAGVCVWMFLFRWHQCLFWWFPGFAFYTVRDDTLGYIIVLGGFFVG